MAQQIAVIGLGMFGSTIAKNLYQMGHNVLAIDSDARLVEEHRGVTTYPVQADATMETVLRELGIQNYDTVVVAIGTDVTANIMATVLLLSLGVNEKRLIVRAENELHADTLRRMGIGRVVSPEKEMGSRLAHTMFRQAMPDYLSITPSYGIGLMKLPASFINKSLKQIGLGGARDRYHAAVLALRRSRNVILSPDEDEQLQEGDWLVLAGSDEQLEKVEGLLSG
jgi:trk system potassium uptake protein TrkA